MSELKQQADVVIIGAGIVGCSVAYHLVDKGVRDIVILEQDRWPEPGGSTSHASDFIFPLDPSRVMTSLSTYGIELYSGLHENGHSCFIRSGGVEVARTPERMGELHRKVSSGKSWGVQAEIISPDETRELFPFIEPASILGAMWCESAGLVTRSVDAARIMVAAGEARDAVRVYPYTTVTGFDVTNGRVRAVHTSKGTIRTDVVVCAAGVWGPLIGQMAGVPIPLAPLHHQLVFTGPVPELEGARHQIEYPLFRDQDRSMYVRQEHGAWEIGSYQHRSIVTEPGQIPAPNAAKYTPTMMPFTPEDFEKPMMDIVEVMPILENAPLQFGFNGLLSVTVDGLPLLGESPNVGGFWTAEAVWVKDGPGVGKLIAEWMIDGEPGISPHELDIARFHPHALTRSHVRARACEGFQKVYGIVHPREQWQSSRNIRRSPFYPRQIELDAEFFESAGWERPQWYNSNQRLLEEFPVPERTGWEAMWWSPVTGAEHQAMRQRVGMIDLSSFVKLEISGPGALAFLERLAMAQVDRPVGSIIYTPLLTGTGGIKSDLTITRLGQDRFMAVTGAGMGMQDAYWIRRHAPQDGSVRLTDMTSSMCVVGVWGPRARDLVQSLTDADLSNEAFPFATARRVPLGPVDTLMLRISYVGEPGWEIYAPMEQGLMLWDMLWEAGQPYEAVAAGLSTYLSSMRLEKGYLLLGQDIHTEYNTYEAGIARPRLKRVDFIGKDALMRIRDDGVYRRLCTLGVVSGQVVMPNETAILSLDGEWLGYVHSADYGYSVGRSIALGYLPLEYAQEGAQVLLEYRGSQFMAVVAIAGVTPLYDPENVKLKS